MTSITSGTNAVASNPPVGQRETSGDVTGQGVVLPQSAVGMSSGGSYVPPLVAAMGMGIGINSHCSVGANQANQMLLQGTPQQYHHYYQSHPNSNAAYVVNRNAYAGSNGTQQPQQPQQPQQQAQQQPYPCPTPPRSNSAIGAPYQTLPQQHPGNPQTPQQMPSSQQAPFRGNIPVSGQTSQPNQQPQQPYFHMQQQPQQQPQPQQPPPQQQPEQSSTPNGSGGYINMWPPQYSTPSANSVPTTAVSNAGSTEMHQNLSNSLPQPPPAASSTVQFPFSQQTQAAGIPSNQSTLQQPPFGYHIQNTPQSNGPLPSVATLTSSAPAQVQAPAPVPQALPQSVPSVTNGGVVNGSHSTEYSANGSVSNGVNGVNGNGPRLSPAATPSLETAPSLTPSSEESVPTQVITAQPLSVIVKSDGGHISQPANDTASTTPQVESKADEPSEPVPAPPPQPDENEEHEEHAEENKVIGNAKTTNDSSRPSSPNASPPPVAASTPFHQNGASSASQSVILGNKIPSTLTFGDAIGALVTDRALSLSPSPRASPAPMHESPSGSPSATNSSSHSLALSGTPMIMPMASTTPLSPECDDCGEGGPMDCSVGHGDGHDGGGMAFPGGAQGPMTSSSSVSGSGAAAGGEDSNGSGSGGSKYQFGHMNSHYEHVCQFCDYTSRTEGRLKRHIKDFHSEVPPPNYSGAVKVVRSGRPKNYRCKQCSFTATSKIEFWEHSRAHIKEDKLLQCPKCPFVTEYKHHLEYHLRNHFGSKPFKCSKCNYSCVNKSMLNSHMKSHTNIYQYRCADCSYATKYCHSLKLHLRKYDHRASNLMTADGSLVVDDKPGDLSQPGTNGPDTPSGLPLSMSLFGPGPAGLGGDDVKMEHDANGDNDDNECEPASLVPTNSGKTGSSAASSSSTGSGVHIEGNGMTNGPGNGVSGGPLSRLPLGVLPGFGMDSPAGVGVPPGWPPGDQQLAPGGQSIPGAPGSAGPGIPRVIPGQMASAMSRLVSGEGNSDPAALASLMGAYYSMLGPQGAPGGGVAGMPPSSSAPNHQMPAMVCAAVPGNGQAAMIKCNTCGFLAPSWPLIMQHVFKVHASEHNDLFRAFGLSPDMVSDLHKSMLLSGGNGPPGSMPPFANGALPPAMAAMLAAGGLPPGMPGMPTQQQLQPSQQTHSSTSSGRRRNHGGNTGSPMAGHQMAQNANSAALNQFLVAAQQQSERPPGARPPGSTAPWPLDLTKSGGSGSGSGSYRDSRSRSSPSVGMNGGGSGSSVSRSTDTPASSSNDAPLTGNEGDRNGLDILLTGRRGGDLVGGNDPSSPASGGSGSGSGTNGDANGRRRARKGKAVKLSALRQGMPSLGSNGSEGDGEGATSGSSGTGGDAKPKLQNGWVEQFTTALSQDSYAMHLQQQQRTGSRIAACDDWAVQSHIDPSGAVVHHPSSRQPPQPQQTQQSGSNDIGSSNSRRQSSSNAPGAGNGNAAAATARQSSRQTSSTSAANFECTHCEMAFRDVVMYTIHMGYHGFLDPFKCNMCGAACRDRVDFFLHIARQAHT